MLISLDRTGTWFRYHHLLRDLLRLEAGCLLGDRVIELNARAAACSTERGEHGRAVEHHLAAGQAPAAAQLMLLHGPELLRDGQIESLGALAGCGRGLPTALGKATTYLAVSLDTVTTHCQAAHRKLGVVDRESAVQAARELHLL